MSSALAIKDRKSFMTWAIFTLFCVLFSIIYEYFSFGVYSPFMVGLALWPLLFGVLPTVFLKEYLGRLWTDGILMATFGSMLQGILEIYGTTSTYPTIMMIAGLAFLAIAVIVRRSGKH